MAGIDPISLAVIGAATGAIASPRDPLKGALLGGAAGFTGGSLLAAPSAAAVSGAAGVAAPSAVMGGGTGLVAPASMTASGLGLAPAAAGMGGGTGLVASTAPTVAGMGAQGITAFGPAATTAAGGITANQALNMGMRGMNMLSQQQQQTPTPSPSMFRGSRQVNATEPIASLFDFTERKRRPVMSLL